MLMMIFLHLDAALKFDKRINDKKPEHVYANFSADWQVNDWSSYAGFLLANPSFMSTSGILGEVTLALPIIAGDAKKISLINGFFRRHDH